MIVKKVINPNITTAAPTAIDNQITTVLDGTTSAYYNTEAQGVGTKNLNNYNEYIKEIQNVSLKVVNDEFKKYARTKILNRTKLREINFFYTKYNSFTYNNWFISSMEKSEDISAILDTAFEYEIINLNTIDIIKKDITSFFSYITEQQLKYIIDKQNNFNVYIPTLDDLEYYGGIKQLINGVIQNDPSLIANNATIQSIITEVLTDRFKTNYFLDASKVDELYLNPMNIKTILTPNEVDMFIKRVAPYLIFINEDFYNGVMNYMNGFGNYTFNDVLTVNELKLMLDKEIDLKNNIMHMFTYEEVKGTFDTFKMELFNNDFRPLINEALEYVLYPELTETITDKWIKEITQA